MVAYMATACSGAKISHHENSSGEDACQFRLGTYMLFETDKIEDLGLLFTSSLNFHQHIQDITQ